MLVQPADISMDVPASSFFFHSDSCVVLKRRHQFAGATSTRITVAAASARTGQGPNSPLNALISGTNQPLAQVNRAPAATNNGANGVNGVDGVNGLNGLNGLNNSPTLKAVQGAATPAAVKGAGYTTATSAAALYAPRSQLFAVYTAPNASYLVETNPAFTNNRAFLSYPATTSWPNSAWTPNAA